MRPDRTVEMSASARDRVKRFIAAYRRAPDDADIEIRHGESESGEPAILISIQNAGDFPLLVFEARLLADAFESAMNAHPNAADGQGLPDLIMSIRYACDCAASPLTREGRNG